jgi:putative radical SAM enzyme (TIGR03279 family)
MSKPQPTPAGQITAVAANSAAALLGVLPGDLLLAVNGHPCQDVIDVQYYSAEEQLHLLIQRGDQQLDLHGQRQYNQALGLDFAHPTFDIDIRRCNNLCEFCFVLQMRPKMRRTLYIKDDDFRYSFLFGHFVTLTNLSDSDWARLIEQHLSPLYVSVHATDLALRRQCLRNPSAPDIMLQLRELALHGFEVHTQLVITPGVNDGPHLEQSLRDLASLYPTVRSVSVVPVGLTKFHKYGLQGSNLAEAEAVLATCQQWQQQFRATFGIGFAYPTDEWYLVAGQNLPSLASYDGLALHENGLGMVRAFLDEWARVQTDELAAWNGNGKIGKVTLATASLFAPTLQGAASQFAASTGIDTQVVAIANNGLGEGISVAGLLLGEDVIAQLKPLAEAGQLGQLLVLPRIMFDHPDGVCLDDKSPLDIANALGCPVALADWMGDVVDAVQGRNKLCFNPGLSPTDIPIIREGGWAVEKYL